VHNRPAARVGIWDAWRGTALTFPWEGSSPTRAYDEFIRHNGLQDIVAAISNSVTAGNIDETRNQERLTQLREKIKEGSIPQLIVEELKTMLSSLGIVERPLAVRSSAAAEDSSKASFAGIHESFLKSVVWAISWRQ